MSVQRDNEEERQARLDLLLEEARVKTEGNQQRADAARRESTATRKQVQGTLEQIRTRRAKRH